MKNRFRGLSESRKLEMLQMSVGEIYNAGYVAGYTKKSFEKQLDAVAKVKPKSPNQRRAELIQRAREFVEKQLSFDIKILRKGMNRFCKAEFIVNTEKRTVVCLLKGLQTKSIWSKAKAKCHPDEVFNADIGKAIALARALEIEVPAEFMDAVQPDEFANGQVILYHDHSHKLKGKQRVIEKIQEDRIEFTNGWYYTFDGRSNVLPKIIDDTHAEYEVPSC